jgi:hypothetical protein
MEKCYQLGVSSFKEKLVSMRHSWKLLLYGENSTNKTFVHLYYMRLYNSTEENINFRYWKNNCFKTGIFHNQNRYIICHQHIRWKKSLLH